jgi:recombination protein RecA
MSSAVIHAQVPSIPESFPEPGRNRLLQLPHGVVPGARLEVRPAPATVPSGIAEIDALTGGLPRGALTEIFGPASSGRTSMILSALAAATRRQEVCALVDAGDSLHPESAAAAGLDLQRLLWIRCGENPPQRRREEIDDLRIDDCRLKTQRPTTNNQRPTSSPQMNADQRGSGILHSSFIIHHSLETRNSTDHWQLTTDNCFSNRQSSIINRQSAWEARLTQVLKATDLLLQSGGFGLVVVDLADVPPRFARRISLASWFRFRRAVENASTVLLVVEQEPYAKTCASLVLKMQHSAVSNQHSANETLAQKRPKQFGGTPVQQPIFSHDLPAHARILREMPAEAEIVHARFQRKPAQSVTAQFATRAAWANPLAG